MRCAEKHLSRLHGCDDDAGPSKTAATPASAAVCASARLVADAIRTMPAFRSARIRSTGGRAMLGPLLPYADERRG